jgi:hypothetical protein
MKFLKVFSKTIASFLALLLIGVCAITAGAQSTNNPPKKQPPPPKPPKTASSPTKTPPPPPKNNTSTPPPKTPPPTNTGGNKTPTNNPSNVPKNTGNNPNTGNNTNTGNKPPTNNPPKNAGNNTNTGNNTNNGTKNTGNNPNTNTGGRNTGNNPNNNTGGRNAGNNPNTNTGGRNAMNQPGGNTHTVTTHSGAVATVNSNGKVTQINNHGTTINHGVNGTRTIVTPLPNGGRVVTTGAHGGYVQNTFVRNNQTFVSRTYVYGGRSFVRVYQPFSYRGVVYNRYLPGFYYRPAFYGWAFAPWGVGISFGWGWGGAAWFGFYGGYFQPYPVYLGPTLWLTDYLLAANLQLAYENQQANGAPPPDPYAQSQPVQLSPEVKQAIADEIQRQLALEQQQSAAPGGVPPVGGNQIPAALDPQMSTIVVTENLQVMDNGQPCELTPGDVLTRIDDTPGPDNAVMAKVTNSKPGDCRAGALPRVQVSDLQDMMNQFQAQVDSGVQQLASQQGKGGIPPAPGGSTTVVQGPGQAPPDPNAANLLQQQQKNADAVEAEIKTNGSGNQ